MKRIDPATVPELYERIGLKPRAGSIGMLPDLCTCLIGALLVDAIGRDDRIDCTVAALQELYLMHEYDRLYLAGLAVGFDSGQSGSPNEHEDLESHYLGRLDGAAANSVLAEKGLLVS